MPRIVYCDDTMPGITRRKVRHGWGYWDPQGNRITDREEIDRLNRIGLPPAYRDAWFSPNPNGHIQAVAGTSAAANNIATTPISAPRRRAPNMIVVPRSA